MSQRSIKASERRRSAEDLTEQWIRHYALQIEDQATLEELLAEAPDANARRAMVERLRPYLTFKIPAAQPEEIQA